ncbi:hypothetical protein CA54_54080 [Symmachiella macrocystis]|uniref:DUF3592 domain-containing protein n=1 Tax=Symmachiella macrocystis TaxID=2527985 RepID=A0A5C6B909_9PLAN|nr:hypothetical protein [Symmachiella macrocystis]TWU07004.1 hypothetical protein CA54_54080 [Symmachiella macrocystis]
MESQELEHSEPIFVYGRSASKQVLGRWMLVGGVGAAILSVLGFVLAIFGRVDQLALHSMSTFPMIIAVGLFTGGWTLIRGPRRVRVGENGIEIEQSSGISQQRWSEIGWVTVNATSMSQQKRLDVFDQSGVKVASVSEAIEDFDDLVATVKSKVADQRPAVAGDIQLRKARKSAVYIASFAVVMILVSASIAWMTYEEQRAAKLLETEAVEGFATIDRLFLAPNGVTTRVEYTCANEAGETGNRNAEIDPAYYAELTQAGAKTIPVIFVPSDPSLSQLQHGEVIEEDFLKTPAGGYGLSALVTVMCLFFLGAAVLQWNGWDIDYNSKTSKFSIKRFGEGD